MFDKRFFNVLLVGGNAADQRLIGQLLKQRRGGARLDLAADVERAKEMAASAAPDVILLDVALPGGRGLDPLLELRADVPGVPIVVLAGWDDEQPASAALQAGAQDYLIKGQMDGPQLARSLRYAIDRNAILRQLYSANDELQQANLRLEKLSQVDPLTELLNRRGLQQTLDVELQRRRRDGSYLVAMLLDLDDFKEVNEAYGHSAGDVVLCDVARLLKSNLRASDTAARIGGDEFMVLLPRTPPGEALRAAERLRLALRGPVALPQASLQLSASAGLALVGPQDSSVEQLVGLTQGLLLQSKRLGKNRVLADWGGEEVTGAADGNLASAIRALHSPAAFYPVRQAIVDLRFLEPRGAEMMSRSTVRHFEMPDDFFRISGDANILAQVDFECFKRCARASACLDQGDWCHLNLFPSTLAQIPPEQILEALPADRRKDGFCIEISEQNLVEEPLQLLEPVEILRRAGVKIGIDDVGYGRSSLENLVYLKPEILKLDRRLVAGIDSNPLLAERLGDLCKIARCLDAEVIAEGIENEAELEAVKRLGIAYGQGYLWGRPVRAA